MFLHLGGGFTVCLEDVIFIYDYGLMTKLARMKEHIVDVSKGRQRTAVITSDTVYISSLSSLTLKKRAEEFHFLK